MTLPNHCYDEPTLEILEHVLRDVWEVLKAHQPYPGWHMDPQLKTELAFQLMALADAGVRDPHELRSRTLESFPLARPH